MRRSIIIICILIILVCFGVSRIPIASVSEPETDDGITLNWMVYGEKYQESDYVFQQFNEKLHQYFPDITVSFEVVPLARYQDTWDMKMTTGEALDIAWIGNDTVNYSEEQKKGSFMVLDYLLRVNGESLLKNIPEELWQKQKRDGYIYAIPVMGPLYCKNYVLCANRNLMERYGDMERIAAVNREHLYTTKECFDVMEEYLEALQENNALAKGVSVSTIVRIADKGYEGIYGQDSPFVIRIFEKHPTVCNKYELESYKACFETMADWYQKGFIRSDISFIPDPEADDGKTLGTVLFVEEYGDNGTVYDDRKTEYDAIRGELDGYRRISFETCRNCLVIPKTARHPEEAMKLLNLLHTEEGKELFRLLESGVEKEQYIRVEKNSNVIARMTDNDRNYRYWLNPVNIGSVFQGFELCEDQFSAIRSCSETALTSSLDGFELDTRMIAPQMAKIDLIVKQYLKGLSQGTEENWEQVYADFLEEMNEAGSERIKEEIQRQIDAFLAKESG